MRVTTKAAQWLKRRAGVTFMSQHVQNVAAVAAHVAKLESGASVDSGPITSSMCIQRHLAGPRYEAWCRRLGEAPCFNRKLWEWTIIGRALEERGVLGPGRRGLGFAVGVEPLTAAFAAMGCEVLATDIDADSDEARRWTRTGDYGGSAAALNGRKLCDADAFAERVRFRAVDMRSIPSDLTGFDFCWSSCALQHLGSIDNGAQFIDRSVDTLRPGGVAAHTLQLNVSPDLGRHERVSTVYYARDDIEALCEKLARNGRKVAPIDWTTGDQVLDNYVDLPPYRASAHLKLLTEGLVCTSFLLLVSP